MLLFKLHFLFGFVFSTCLTENYDQSVIRCRNDILHKNDQVPTLEGLVGVGWDNLMNIPFSAVLASNFSECRTSPDLKFLIPDNMQVLPVKQTDLDRAAEYYKHHKDAFEATTFKINSGVSLALGHLGSISGSFSAKYQETKEKMVGEKSSMFHTKLLYHAYTLIVQAGSELHPTFKARLLSIDDALEKNLTRRAKYLAETVIRDFGTHVLTKVEAGAKIEQEDYVESSTVELKSSFLTEFKYSISAGFLNNILGASLGVEVSFDKETKEALFKATRHSHIKTYGGPTVNHLLAATFSGAKPASQTQFTVDDLVALDANGVPLYNLISEQNLLGIRPTRVDRIRNLLKDATELYYKKNLHTGCMDPNARNFNYQANYDDGNCLKPFNNYTFGGVYQTCTPLPEINGYATNPQRCDGLSQPNGITGGFSCAEGYDPVLLYDLKHQFPDWTEHTCQRKCHSCWLFAKCCNTICTDIIHQEKAQLTAYWCKAKPGVPVGQDHGYMFGGLFINGQHNPFTGSSSCPGHFQPFRLGFDVSVCLSRDYQLDAMFDVKFAGFFSCQTPPVAQKCENGYSQHLVTVLEGCEIYYCVRPEAFNRIEESVIKRPPYEDITALTSNDTESAVYIYIDDELAVKSSLKDVLVNVSIERNNLKGKTNSSANDTDNGLLSNSISEEKALDMWLGNIYEAIDENLEQKYLKTMVEESSSISTTEPQQTMIPLVKQTITSQKPPEDNPSSANTASFSHGTTIGIIVFLGLLLLAIGAILYYNRKKKTRIYNPLLGDNNQTIINYEFDH
uniref:Macrophage-expressed gene 1 protein n=1 Tax=Acrobeloides nanus TaxID=290746 RepID=A0A914ENN9_9BILA